MIPFTVIGGYLGAGKTTLLNRLLQADSGRRIALLINDFGDINIDAALIDSRSDNQINLTNGCVCCSLADGFSVAIEELLALDPRPEQVIVEASGVANVGNLAQYGHGHDLRLDGVLVLADAETVVRKAADKYVGQTIRQQLQAADLIVLNKCDLIDNHTRSSVHCWLKESFPNTPVVETIKADVSPDLLSGLDVQQTSVTVREHDHFASLTIDEDIRVEIEAVESFLAALPDSVLRVKGFASLRRGGTLLVQRVGQRSDLSHLSSGYAGIQLVLIGPAQTFDAAEIKGLVKQYLFSI